MLRDGPHITTQQWGRDACGPTTQTKARVPTELHYQELNVDSPLYKKNYAKATRIYWTGLRTQSAVPCYYCSSSTSNQDSEMVKAAASRPRSGRRSAVSSLEDARRLCVYLMDLAVELMEERTAPGIVFIVDVANCTLANLEAKMVTDILQVCKNWYPEVVKRILVVNSSAFTKVLTMLLAKLLGARTQQRIRVMGDPRELNMMLPPPAIPQCYGGS
ncbi:CRAL/TRIO domain, partial [Phytophthora infestans]